ncbi:MAG: MBL fold metallo-hydrolase [Dysgonomonas sp.]|nr:MBL fold metallo-hydrolase [Dysgonomonas sp.]
MKLTYIFHSGFAIEYKGITIIIDYYKDSSDDKNKGIVYSHLLKNPGKLYVLSSHSHSDHFNKEILQWKNEKDDITYIFSKDILDNKKAKASDATYLEKLDTYKDDNLFIQAFGSTDIGISFLIKLDGHTIFHAGDLNNWHWNEESTPEEITEAETYFANELNTLAQHIQHINLAMFPVDWRLGKDYMKGAEQFISTIKVDTFAPMHFVTDYKSANAFASTAEKYECKFIEIKEKGQRIII